MSRCTITAILFQIKIHICHGSLWPFVSACSNVEKSGLDFPEWLFLSLSQILIFPAWENMIKYAKRMMSTSTLLHFIISRSLQVLEAVLFIEFFKDEYCFGDWKLLIPCLPPSMRCLWLAKSAISGTPDFSNCKTVQSQSVHLLMCGVRLYSIVQCHFVPARSMLMLAAFAKLGIWASQQYRGFCLSQNVLSAICH